MYMSYVHDTGNRCLADQTVQHSALCGVSFSHLLVAKIQLAEAISLIICSNETLAINGDGSLYLLWCSNRRRTRCNCLHILWERSNQRETLSLVYNQAHWAGSVFLCESLAIRRRSRSLFLQRPHIALCTLAHTLSLTSSSGVFPIRRNPFHRILEKYIVCSCFVKKNHTPYLQLHF